MIPILIAYSTAEGQTRKIAEFMGSALAEAGYRADVVEIGTPQEAQVQPLYSAAIVGGSVHAGRHSGQLAQFVRANEGWLKAIPFAFFSVSLTAARDDSAAQDATQRMLDEFIAATGLTPARSCRIAGALRYSEYGPVKRALMKTVVARAGGPTDTSLDHEFTDWEDVRRFVLEFVRDYDGQPRKVA